MISIIIPTLNEATHIGRIVATLSALPGPQREIIVSDGGSSDQTVPLAHENGAVIVETARGRGAQLNAGADRARGAILWFVHADARLHPLSLKYLEKCVSDVQICGGNFRLRFESEKNFRWPPHLFARIARQQRRLGVYYGDSGVWVRREVFWALNGYRSWSLFEDYDFVRRLENYARWRGTKTALAPWPVMVSSRRFRGHPIRTLKQWLWLQILFSCGVSPEKLAKIYHKKN